jgi:hypothetical protein
MKGRPVLWPDVVIILAAICFALAHPTLGFLDGPYADGFYPAVQTTVTSWTNRIPFAIADLLLVLIVLALALHWTLSLRASPRWSTAGELALRTAAVAGFLYVWFLIAWGWNYDRPGLATTLHYHETHVDEARLDRIELALLDALNAAAAPAHAAHDADGNLRDALAAARERTALTIGITHAVVPTRPKRTILDPYFVAADISGMFMPFTYETYIASDVLWFEYPFTLEHEWGHAEGVARESDANFIASLATLDSPDPILHYSGLLIVYAAMPRRAKIDARLSRLVRADYAAMRGQRTTNT